MDERRSLTHAVDQIWGESVTLSVTEHRSRKRVDTTTDGKLTVVYDQYAVERTKTLRQEVLELHLTDKPVPSSGETPVGESEAEDETPMVLNPEDLFQDLVPEPATPDTLSPEEREPPTQSVPVPGLGEVLESRSEGTLTIGSGKDAQQIRYDGPRFEIRGGVYFRVD